MNSSPRNERLKKLKEIQETARQERHKKRSIKYHDRHLGTTIEKVGSELAKLIMPRAAQAFAVAEHLANVYPDAVQGEVGVPDAK